MRTILIGLLVGVLAMCPTTLKGGEQAPDLRTPEGALEYMQDFYRTQGSSVTVVECSAFVAKTINGRQYFVAKELVTMTTAFGPAQRVMGIIVDGRWTQVLPIPEYREFLRSGYRVLPPDLNPNN